MWRDHPFNQRARQQKKQWGWRLGGRGEGGGGGWTKFVKKGLGSVGGLNEIEGYKSYASCGDFEGRYHLKLEKFFMLLYCMRVKNHNSK